MHGHVGTRRARPEVCFDAVAVDVVKRVVCNEGPGPNVASDNDGAEAPRRQGAGRETTLPYSTGVYDTGSVGAL